MRPNVNLETYTMTKTAHVAGALLLLCVLTLIFSPVARFPSVWILLSVSAVVFVAAVSGAGAAARNLREADQNARQEVAELNPNLVG